MRISQNDGSMEKDKVQGISDEIQQAVAGHEFGSLAEVNAFVGQFMQQRNERSMEIFQGLSPYQMHRLLAFPFDSPDVVTFSDAPVDAPVSPVMRMFALMIEAIGEKGVKPTQTGNLPRNMVRSLALAYWGEEGYREHTKYGDLRSEKECWVLHLTRLVTELAGLVHIFHGKIMVTKKCRTLCAHMGMAAVYPLLFRAYTMGFNWEYLSQSADVPLIQQSFLFTAFLLQRFGEEWRDTDYYEDAFLQAFPDTLAGFVAGAYFTPDLIVRATYSGLALHQYAESMGLAEVRRLGESMHYRYEIRKLPLVDTAITFHV